MAELTHDDAVFRPKPALPPPPNTAGVIGWLRKNLFGGPVDTLLTLAGSSLIAYTAYKLLQYGLFNEVWEAESYRDCLDFTKGNGACSAGVDLWVEPHPSGPYPGARP